VHRSYIYIYTNIVLLRTICTTERGQMMRFVLLLLLLASASTTTVTAMANHAAAAAGMCAESYGETCLEASMMFPAPPKAVKAAVSTEHPTTSTTTTTSASSLPPASAPAPLPPIDARKLLARPPLPSPVPSPQPPLPLRNPRRPAQQYYQQQQQQHHYQQHQHHQHQQHEKYAVVVVLETVLMAIFWGTCISTAVLFTCFGAVTARHRGAVQQCSAVLLAYWRSLFHYWSGGDYLSNPHFRGSTRSRVHMRSLALITELWHQPHYRSGTFGGDMAKNLRNVALPGTGLALSTLCISPTFFKLVLLVVYPVVALAAALLRREDDATAEDVAAAFTAHLVRPTDWFSLWRLNCRLASYHALKTQDCGYSSEDKWTFITEALKLQIPVSPILDIPNLVCKDRNEEGGMGIHFFQNALVGGDWIIQKSIKNSEFLQTMLPHNAPLSTIRIVTGSSMSLANNAAEADADAKAVKALSCVFRAGRAGAATDHDAILFDVDLKTGLIGKGTINREWYQLGLQHVNLANLRGRHRARTCTMQAGSSSSTSTSGGTEGKEGDNEVGVFMFTKHPDCGAAVSGVTIPDIAELEAICIDAHRKSCPNVPLCGWDVALTTEGVVLLEVNLSCNFFQATVDYDAYFEFVDAHFRHLSQL